VLALVLLFGLALDATLLWSLFSLFTAFFFLLALMATLASRLNDEIFSLAKALESGEASTGDKSAMGGPGTRLRGWAKVRISIINY
jgi:hypothetical protein